MTIKSEDIVKFWFEEIDPAQHWKKDDNFDREIERRFGPTLEIALQGGLWQWRNISPIQPSQHQQHQNKQAQADPLGRLAEIIVLDQFSRNIYRGRAQSFAQDSMALVLAQEAVSLGCFEPLSPRQQAFMIMPYMHSEATIIHQQAVMLFEKIGNPDNLNFELRHQEIISRFGRYPHRNDILERISTVEEVEFLQQPGSGF